MHQVSEVLDELGLMHVKTSRVGDGLVRGISGGERRRLSIACQLIKFTRTCRNHDLKIIFFISVSGLVSEYDKLKRELPNVPVKCLDKTPFPSDILLLDEPTTGLDSFNAYNLIETLSRLSRKNIVVIATIHQPRLVTICKTKVVTMATISFGQKP